MKWFKHDSDASTDAKVKKLLIRYGAVGYAIYFHCIELIANDISEHNITFELEHDSEIIADNLKIKGTADKSGIEIVEEIMKYIISLDLFTEKNNKIFCFKLLKRLDTSMTSNVNFRSLITKAKESHDLIMTESCKKRLEENRSEEKDIEKIKFHDYVYLTQDEHQKLVDEYKAQNVKEYIEKLDNYLTQHPDKKLGEKKGYKDLYKTLRSWLNKDRIEHRSKYGSPSTTRTETQRMTVELARKQNEER